MVRMFQFTFGGQLGKFALLVAYMFIVPCTFLFGQLPPPQQLSFSNTHVNDLTLSGSAAEGYQIKTTGGDPYLFTEKLTSDLPETHMMLSFEYFCTTGVELQIYFGDPIEEERSVKTALGVAEGWTTFSLDVKNSLLQWGKPGNYLRMDFGSKAGRTIQIRNIRFRAATPKELEAAKNREQIRQRDIDAAARLNSYLQRHFPDSLTHISVTADKITVKGTTTSAQQSLYLSEISVDQQITEEASYAITAPIKQHDNTFVVTLDRYIDKPTGKYDRLLSKWAVLAADGQRTALRSHARYADEVQSLFDLPDETPRNKKGLGGFGGNDLAVGDLDSLDISSVTVNIWITRLMRSAPSAQNMPFSYLGKTYYVDKGALASLDRTLSETVKRNIITSAIILVGKASSVADKKIGEIFEHPGCDPAGIYSMANLTSPESAGYYAAIIDFLAQRYSGANPGYGRIHHWIVHNEVDAGWVWTNMGDKPPLVFMDHYIKSMRTIYLIARKYNAHAKVFISLTHFWAWTEDPHFYHPKELLDILLRYSRAEGDFDWAIAQHPYPESLFEPKSWLDSKVDFTFDSPLITFKNIEVLDAWVEQPQALYLGKHKRIIYLSEQGTNSRDYSEKSLTEQAAGMAYAWKKIKDLPNIKAFQYHNWRDARDEGGLRIGLRRFRDDADDPSGKKPVWYVYRDMGTAREDEAFEFAKPLISISDWSEVIYKGPIGSDLSTSSN